MMTGLLLRDDASLHGAAYCQGLLQRDNGGTLKVVLAVHCPWTCLPPWLGLGHDYGGWLERRWRNDDLLICALRESERELLAGGVEGAERSLKLDFWRLEQLGGWRSLGQCPAMRGSPLQVADVFSLSS
jgi:hypothetical protein